MEKNEEKWFSPTYSSDVLNVNKLGYQLHNFPGFRDEHLPIPFLKSTFEEVWEQENALLRQTCGHRFRSVGDVSDWLMRYWQLAKGAFAPRMPKGIAVSVSDSKEVLRDVLLNPRYPVICLNEGREEVDFKERSEYLRNLFEIIMPEMSSFELY
ncbi:MAG: stealth conserved region 3 domain-containing protein [Lachnospiraceae bacterium]|nr:stealth conserved region 3 domain-containing protein [Lachnospiraceae bacterium]